MAKETAHVVVVGAGVVGCAIAYELARRGSRVRILDRRDVGQGATRASAGVLAPYIAAHADGPLLELGARSLALYDEFVAHVVEDSGATVQYVRNGTVEVALDEPAAERFRGLLGRYRDHGARVEYLDRRALHDAEPQLCPGAVGGVAVPVHGHVAAADLTSALRRAAGAYGVTFTPATAVSRVSRRNEALQVETGRETISCEAVVIAAGSWSGQVESDGEESIPVRPVRGQLLHLGWPTGTPDRVIWTDGCYVVPWNDGTVLVGATTEEVGFDERATVAGIQELIDRVCRLVPRARDAWFQEVRVGLRPGTPDDLPAIGAAAARGVFYATGHYRNGVLLAPLTAALVADLVLENRRDPALGALDPGRFAG